MSDKYKITEQEINQILMGSPHALDVDLPKRGMSAENIRKFFYDFIMIFAKKLNPHLEDVEAGIAQALAEADVNLELKLGEHNKNEGAHSDIRQSLDSVRSLAAGKARVHPTKDWQGMCDLLFAQDIGVGDSIVIAERGIPDFVVQELDADEVAGDVVFYSGMSDPYIEPGKSYYFQDKRIRLLSLESGIDLNKLVLKTEYDADKNRLSGEISKHISDENAHSNIKSLAQEAYDSAQTANNSLQAVLGRRSVYYESTLSLALGTVCDDIYGFNSGDMIVVGEVGVPDLIVFGAETEPIFTATETITAEQIRSGTASVVTGGRYKIEGSKFGVVAIESGVSVPDIKVDTVFDAESSNAVANSAVTRKFDEVGESINGVGNIAEGAILNANEAVSIAKGANQAVSFFDYDELIDAFNDCNETPAEKYMVGQNIYIQEVNVPDLWVVANNETYVDYLGSSDDLLTEILDNNREGVRIGYHCVAMLETQKVDLTEYVKKDTSAATTPRVYGKYEDGSQATFPVAGSATRYVHGRIPQILGETDGETQPSGFLLSNNPINPYHVATKSYVDSEIQVLVQRIAALENKEQEV